jgi:hypothetical protein
MFSGATVGGMGRSQRIHGLTRSRPKAEALSRRHGSEGSLETQRLRRALCEGA